MPYRILTFDGGGILGIFSARILHHLLNAYPNLLNNTDLIAGTSTGGIISLGLASGMSPDQLVALYQTNGQAIFDRSWLHNIADLGGLSGAQYDNQNQLSSTLSGKQNWVIFKKGFWFRALISITRKILGRIRLRLISSGLGSQSFSTIFPDLIQMASSS